jgi:hypothetical protein
MLIRHHVDFMKTPFADTLGFSHPTEQKLESKRRDRAFAELITVAALSLSLAVAVTAVSIGIARADSASASIHTRSVQ